MKIYTKTGDKGKTTLYGGVKVPKNHIRIESYGTIDELNSVLGIIRALNTNQEIDNQLNKIQNELFNLGAELATPNEKFFLENGEPRLKNLIHKENVEELETLIDKMELELEPLTQFILPSGNQLIAQTHLGRTICRRAERIVVALTDFEDIRNVAVKFLNRLSDYLFVLARYFAKIHNIEEIKWNQNV